MAKPPSVISEYYTKLLSDYDNIRGKHVPDGVPYWDVVVITTADKEQSSIYEAQLKQKYDRHELPLGFEIHILHDPPGPKIGNGGSTLTALNFLAEKYGDNELVKKRVLLIHAGGQSQRMPSASVLGKIFSPIPKGNPIYQMLDFKLAMFMPFIPYMCPGVFVTCADDFIVYLLPADPDIEFASTGFTAFAHPSTIELGVGHGVYVIEDLDKIDPTKLAQVSKCKEVLQKASAKVLYERGAVLQQKDLKFCDDIKVSENAVYVDSSFFFAHNITTKFLKFYRSSSPITCEIDAYGDFLQALGSNASDAYVKNTGNVSTITTDLLETRMAVYNLLKNSELSLIVLNCSKFIHIGTTKEYIESYCCDVTFQRELGLGKDVFNAWTSTESLKNGDAVDEPQSKRPCLQESDTATGCVMHSILPLASNIPYTSVVEFCHFDVPVNIGQNSIVNNCEFLKEDISPTAGGDTNVLSEKLSTNGQCPSVLNFPDNTFIHTIPVTENGVTKYATVVFDIKDNLKKAADNDNIHKLPYLGKCIEDYIETLDIDVTKVKFGMEIPGSKVNLWFSRLFPLVDSMSQSLLMALQSVEALKKGDKQSVTFGSLPLVSMAAILKQKAVFEMLQQRNKVYLQIKSKQKC